ncbi:MAG: hypothetical protein ABR555_20205, partial [Pyrinomonadaceae bacterium]
MSLEGSAIIAASDSKTARTYLLAAGDAAGAAGEDCCAGVGVGVATGALSGTDCNTDREPLKIGKPSASAINI